ncbi:hypothetical protein [Salipiger sp. PrR002]|uniref:hypothetical protein n=1 Tax=Salipiger sp. PrR002 TaxID=2706489 RepID=UPI0013B8BAF7|nr:hypothetical protein [Salipiger sp. PrR002]NDW01591.1 hypothetical protein [Salipiger sp. PrR002]NDW58302.1 hypothetical protein [Salipiger sp. PrR004]
MSATPFDSTHLHRLFPAGELAKLFSDSAEIRALMIVAGTLAKVQGEAGLIPETAAKAIHRAALELQIDPGGLARATAACGSVVPPLLEAFASLMQAPDYAQYLGQGARPEDLQDCALALRLRQVLAQFETSLDGLDGTQDLRAELPALRDALLCVSLGGENAEILRPALAEALNLGAQGWGADRRPLRDLADWGARLVHTLAAGTPDDAPLAALAVQVGALSTALDEQAPENARPAPMQRHLESLTLPQLLLACGAAMRRAHAFAETAGKTPPAGE